MERPMQNPEKRIKHQPTKIAGAEAKKNSEVKAEVKKEEKKEELNQGSATPIQSKETKTEEAKQEKKPEEKEKKEEKKEITKKTEAVVNGKNLGISKKHSMAICDLIRGKNPEKMIRELELVASMKKPLRMRGEIPHRKGNLMSGRYPVNACKVFINLLKSLIANSSVNGLENPFIAKAKADDASRPFKRGGSMRFKRTNVLLIAKERVNKESKKEEEKEEKKEISKKTEENKPKEEKK